MDDFSKIKESIEKVAQSNKQAIELQMSFFETFSRRQAQALAELSDARINSLKEMAGSGAIDKAFAQNAQFESDAKQRLEQLHGENVESFNTFSTTLKSLYKS
jgi:hypothetical protein